MLEPFGSRSGPNKLTPTDHAVRLGLLLLPALLLLVGSLRLRGETGQLLLFGTAFLLFLCTAGLLTHLYWSATILPPAIAFYGVGLVWLHLATRTVTDWYVPLAQALLLVVPLGIFALQTLRDIGAPTLRRARILAQRLENRRDWPNDLDACRSLPEVKALRECLYLDAAPALPLLSHNRPQVQIAALAALDFRKNWRQGQAEVVLQVALRAEEPAVRAAALGTLANLQDRTLIEALAEFFRDPSQQVRRAATEALLWDTDHRWHWIRHAVRRALADPLCQEDGPLLQSPQALTVEAVADLTAWAAEKGLLGLRAALTLGAYYGQALAEGPDADLMLSLHSQLADVHAPPVLRMEIAMLLNKHQQLGRDLLHQMLDPANPAPLRLTAVEALLTAGDSVEARAALRELARLPNREIALATADVVQRHLKIELGLAAGQPLPPPQSRQATDISRRVRAWAAQYDLNGDDDQAQTPRSETPSWHTVEEN